MPPYFKNEFWLDLFSALFVTMIIWAAAEIWRPGMISAHINFFMLLSLIIAVGVVATKQNTDNNYLVSRVTLAFIAGSVSLFMLVAVDGGVILRSIIALLSALAIFLLIDVIKQTYE